MSENQVKQAISKATAAYKDTATNNIILEFETEQTLQVGNSGKEKGNYATIRDSRITAAFERLEDNRDEYNKLENADISTILAHII